MYCRLFPIKISIFTSSDSVTFVLPNFNSSTSTSQSSLSLFDLKTLDAATAEFRVGMPTGFKLDTAATTALIDTKPYTITQDAATGEVVLTYNHLSAATGSNTSYTVFVQGTFENYVGGTTATASTPNVLTVVTNDGQTLTAKSPANNIFNYATTPTVQYYTTASIDYSAASSGTVILDLERAASTTDKAVIKTGILYYYGAALKDAHSEVTIPDGFTTTAMTVSVDANLLSSTNTTELPYQITYTDGTVSTGTLVSGNNTVTLDATKTVQKIDYQYDSPAIAKATYAAGDTDSVTGKSTYRYTYAQHVTLPNVTLNLVLNSDVTVGDYTVDSKLTGKNMDGSDYSYNGAQKIKVIDGQTDAYVTLGTVKAQAQTSTAAGEVLTAGRDFGLSTTDLSVKAGLPLSNGKQSVNTNNVAQFLNQPVFYFVAPAQTHLVGRFTLQVQHFIKENFIRASIA